MSEDTINLATLRTEYDAVFDAWFVHGETHEGRAVTLPTPYMTRERAEKWITERQADTPEQGTLFDLPKPTPPSAIREGR